MNHISLFSGEGGFDLAAHWMGWNNIAHCEINPFCRRILSYYWPEAISHTDIKKTDFSQYNGTVDIISGGFPCQPYSVAGLRKGIEDDRHLWPEMLRAIREISPRWVVGENVRGLISWNGGLVFDQVQADLEAEGYEVLPVVLPAAGVNSPHRRERVWFIAYSGSERRQQDSHRAPCHEEEDEGRSKEYNNIIERDGESRVAANANGDGFNGRSSSAFRGPIENNTQLFSKPRGHAERKTTSYPTSERLREKRQNLDRPEKWDSGNGSQWATTDPSDPGWTQFNLPGFAAKPEYGTRFHYEKPGNWESFPTQSPICGGNDGLPAELDGITFSKWRNESIKAHGNAIIPQVALQIFRAIAAYEK